MKKLVSIVSVLFTIVLILPTYSLGGNQTFCKTYANTAVDQYNQGKQQNLPGIVPPAWSNDRNGHYLWCMGTPENIVNNENAKRQAYLDKNKPKSISGENLITDATIVAPPLGIHNLDGMHAVPKGSNQTFCKTYANTAVDQYNQGKQQNLPGIVPPAWSNDRNGHYLWCMGAPKNIVSNENTKRQAYLDKNKPKLRHIIRLKFKDVKVLNNDDGENGEEIYGWLKFTATNYGKKVVFDTDRNRYFPSMRSNETRPINNGLYYLSYNASILKNQPDASIVISAHLRERDKKVLLKNTDDDFGYKVHTLNLVNIISDTLGDENKEVNAYTHNSNSTNQYICGECYVLKFRHEDSRVFIRYTIDLVDKIPGEDIK